MTDGTTPDFAVDDTADRGADHEAAGGGRAHDASAPGEPEQLEHPPRAGDLSTGWRVVTALTWICVAAALAAVWNTSVQLGLATWWLGPRSAMQPVVVRLLPFAPSLLMVLASINQIRRLPAFGLVAAASIAVVGIVDLAYVRGLAVIELAIAAAAGVVSAAAFTGVYRRGPGVGTASPG